MEPLAYKLRPKQLEDIVGQDHLIGTNGVITRMLKNMRLPSIILYGSPGIGKTTIALAICTRLGVDYHTFNASIDNKAALKEIIDQAQDNQPLILIIDEIHRMKKDIQDYLLPFVEKGTITLIGLTTINPYQSINPAVRSRCTVLRLNSLSDSDLEIIFRRTFAYLDKDIIIDTDAEKYIISLANGDVRSLINMIECLSFTLTNEKKLTLLTVKEVLLKANVSIDKNEDSFYDTLSGLHKSIRGSDVNASLHYLAKLVTSEDFLPLIRRLYCIFYEDISLANPNLGPRVKAACEAALELGMPEAVLPLSSIVVEMALSPKSNSTYLAFQAAMKDIEEGRSGSLPLHLKNTYSFDPKQGAYKYPHDYPGAWVDQQYLPDKIKNAQYWTAKPTSQYEESLKERAEAIKKAKKNN
ncbi:MAG TPA: replication-associated recombination protein A [Bacilli bacterium]|nr:replication-associated recombination protein A [Bacilli bacterium]